LITAQIGGDGRLSFRNWLPSGLTAKALLHYDRVKLLQQAAVDGANGYRLYLSDQVAEATAGSPAALAGPAAGPGAGGRHRVEGRRRRSRQRGDPPAPVSPGCLAHPAARRSAPHRPPAFGRLATVLSDLDTSSGTATTKSPPGHRRGAAGRPVVFNQTWRLLEQEGRTRDDDDPPPACAGSCAK
jgi:hypothetical protein